MKQENKPTVQTLHGENGNPKCSKYV